jgi:hypothetical protein
MNKSLLITCIVLLMVLKSVQAQWSVDPSQNLRINPGEITTMVSNSRGELFVLWNFVTPRLQKFDHSGNSLWGLGKYLTIDTAEVYGNLGTKSSLLTDDIGNCFVIWHDSRRYEYPASRIDADAMIQGFSPNGDYLFSSSGKYLGTLEYPSLASFIGLYKDSILMIHIAYTESMFENYRDSHLQLIDKSGNSLYQVGGVKTLIGKSLSHISSPTQNGGYYLFDISGNVHKIDIAGTLLWSKKKSSHVTASHVFPEGGIIFAGSSWRYDTLGNYNLLFNSFDSAGNSSISDTGIFIANNAHDFNHCHIIPSDEQSVIVGYTSSGSWTYLIKMTRDGKKIWERDSLFKYGYINYKENGKAIVSNQNNGAIIVSRNTNIFEKPSENIAVNIGIDGNYIWKNKYKTITNRTEAVLYERYMAVNDGDGGVIIGWTERGSETIPGTYIQRVNKYGNLGEVGLSVRKISNNSPLTFQVSNVYPNPTNGNVKFTVDIHISSEIRISLYTILGQKIKSIINKYMDKGKYQIQWDFTSQENTLISSGLYCLMVENEYMVTSRKILVVK